MQCPRCQFENREGAKFCLKCGEKLEFKCPMCGKQLPGEAMFCDECGHNLTLLSEPPPKELSFNEKIKKIQRYLPKDKYVIDTDVWLKVLNNPLYAF